MSEILNNIPISETPVQQRIHEKLKELPADALAQLDDFAHFLVARAESGFYSAPEHVAPGNELSSNEGFFKALQLLSPGDAQIIDQYVLFRAACLLKSRYADHQSLSLAMDLMARDPFLRKEMEAINREFKCAESDGLGPY